MNPHKRFVGEIPHPEGLREEKDFIRPERIKRKTPELLRTTEDGGEIYKGMPIAEMIKFETSIGEMEKAEALTFVQDFSQKIKEVGGQVMLVGGFVRDSVMGFSPKDVDIEVYGLPADQVEEILHPMGKVEDVGKAFGILKVILPSGLDIDVNLPRTDSKVAEGHKGFAVNIDETMTIKEAAQRRDFTFNTVSQDPETGEIYDYYGGVRDATDRVLRFTDRELFQDDPLRVLRGIQFTARFGLEIDPETQALMREMVPRLSEIGPERQTTEWEKLLTKSEQPSRGLQMMVEWGIVSQFYPELDILRHTPQEFDWHPEGTVWVHSLMVVDEARKIATREGLSKDDTFDLVMAGLFHDVGKSLTTAYEEKGEHMRITSTGHEQAGREITEKFLDRFAIKAARKEKIVTMVTQHMAPGALRMTFDTPDGGSPERAIRKLAKRLDEGRATITDAALIAEADAAGRGPFEDPDVDGQYILPFTENSTWILREARKLSLDQQAPPPFVQGRDLFTIAAFRELPKSQRVLFGQFIQRGEALRDEHSITKKDFLTFLDEQFREGRTFEDVLTLLDQMIG